VNIPTERSRTEPDAFELTLDLDSWEGPLDLLLALARAQKVDLRAISILKLVDQYIDYVKRAGAGHLEQAADYLVMAAWLAYLKSCLLLPRAEQEDPSPEELAFRLQQRLRRLDAMRDAGARLMARDRLDRDVFIRSAPEGLKTDRKAIWRVSLFDLLGAYGRVNARTAPVLHQVSRRPVMTLEAALNRIEAMLGTLRDWTAIAAFLPAAHPSAGDARADARADPVVADLAGADYRRSALASTVVATLELARRGSLDLRQDAPFGPILVKAT
jgi:segregation and condensation protein A